MRSDFSMGPPETLNGKTTQIIHADSNASYNRGRLYHLIRAGSKQRGLGAGHEEYLLPRIRILLDTQVERVRLAQRDYLNV